MAVSWGEKKNNPIIQNYFATFCKFFFVNFCRLNIEQIQYQSSFCTLMIVWWGCGRGWQTVIETFLGGGICTAQILSNHRNSNIDCIQIGLKKQHVQENDEKYR